MLSVWETAYFFICLITHFRGLMTVSVIILPRVIVVPSIKIDSTTCVRVYVFPGIVFTRSFYRLRRYLSRMGEERGGRV